MKLREYQKLAIQHTLRRIEEGCNRLYITLPTGTGKSIILACVAFQRRQAGRILVLIHRQDIALQLAKVLRRGGLSTGLLMQGHRELSAPVVVATTQSLTPANLHALLEACEEPLATILIDEAHHAIVGSAYERIITEVETAAPTTSPVITIGCTATPYRSDKQSMLSLLPTCAFARDIPDMVRDGWLAPLTWEPVRIDIDLDEIKMTRQWGEPDYAEEELARKLTNTLITNVIVQQIASRIGQRPTLVFAVTVEHAQQLAEAFCRYGLAARAISGDTTPTERERIFADWRAGALQVVCNCALLTEGFDFPQISALVIARPTLSPGLYLQMLGRGTRLAAGKKDCLVLDLIGNHPETSHQVVLPQVVGVVRTEGVSESERRAREMTDPILKALLGAKTETSLTLLDPIGQSQYRWIAYRGGYFAMVGRHEAAIIERDPRGSGLYRSRLYSMPREQLPEHRWIEQAYLPLRQQVALVHDFTGAISVKALNSKEADWLDEPASDRQLQALQRLHPGLARQARTKGWTKRIASDAITFCLLRKTLMHPPS